MILQKHPSRPTVLMFATGMKWWTSQPISIHHLTIALPAHWLGSFLPTTGILQRVQFWLLNLFDDMMMTEQPFSTRLLLYSPFQVESCIFGDLNMGIDRNGVTLFHYFTYVEVVAVRAAEDWGWVYSWWWVYRLLLLASRAHLTNATCFLESTFFRWILFQEGPFY